MSWLVLFSVIRVFDVQKKRTKLPELEGGVGVGANLGNAESEFFLWEVVLTFEQFQLIQIKVGRISSLSVKRVT